MKISKNVKKSVLPIFSNDDGIFLGLHCKIQDVKIGDYYNRNGSAREFKKWKLFFKDHHKSFITGSIFKVEPDTYTGILSVSFKVKYHSQYLDISQRTLVIEYVPSRSKI